MIEFIVNLFLWIIYVLFVLLSLVGGLLVGTFVSIFSGFKNYICGLAETIRGN